MSGTKRNPRGAIISAIWAGNGTGSAPDAEDFVQGAIGADQDGVTGASTYHVVGAAGSKSWVATGATVANLYGG